MSSVLNRLLLLLALLTVFSVEASAKRSQRIIGGTEVTGKSVPYMASISYFDDHNCGGSIINARTIISAAHCLDKIFLNHMMVHVGSNTIDANRGKVYEVKEVHLHPNYNRALLIYDIGILRLNESLHFTEEVQPIRLVNKFEIIKDNTPAVVYGWGNTDYDGYVSTVLKELRLRLINRDICQKGFKNEITDYMLCAGGEEGNPCKADSGGPLIQNGMVIGVLSWSNKLCSMGSVYTSVKYCLPWLTQTLQDNYGEQI